jgi:hypothetical protein
VERRPAGCGGCAKSGLVLRLESGAAFIFMGLRGFLNAGLLRLEMRENAVGGSAAGALAAVFAGGGIGAPCERRGRSWAWPPKHGVRRRDCLERLPVAGVAVRMLRPRWD